MGQAGSKTAKQTIKSAKQVSGIARSLILDSLEERAVLKAAQREGILSLRSPPDYLFLYTFLISSIQQKSNGSYWYSILRSFHAQIEAEDKDLIKNMSSLQDEIDNTIKKEQNAFYRNIGIHVLSWSSLRLARDSIRLPQIVKFPFIPKVIFQRIENMYLS